MGPTTVLPSESWRVASPPPSSCFENVRVLTAAIERFTREWTAGATPFTWVQTADEILANAVRKPQADSGARH